MGFNFLNVGLVALLNTGVEWATALLDWASRKPITINGASKTPTLNEDFDTPSFTWTKAGTLFAIDSVTDNRFEATCDRSTTNHHERIDLQTEMGEALGDSFVCDCDLELLTWSGNATDVDNHFGFSDVTGATSGSEESGKYFNVQFGLSSSARKFNQNLIASGTMNNAPTQIGDIAVGVGIWYVRMVRDNDKFTTIFYADSDRSEVIGTLTETLTGMTSLRYFRFQNHTVATAGGSGTWVVDNLKVYNNITTVENIPSQQTATYETGFDVSTGWTTTNATYLDVDDVTNERLDFLLNTSSLNEEIYRDLGAGFGSSRFTAQMKIHFTSLINNSTAAQAATFSIGLSDTTTLTAEVPTNDIVYCMINAGNTIFQNTIKSADGTSSTTGTSSNDTPIGATDDGLDVWLKLWRNGDVFSWQLYSDSALQTPLDVVHTVTKSNVGALRYFFVRLFSQTVTGGNLIEGYIDDLEIYNNITEVNPTTLTDYPLTVRIQGDADLQRKTAETEEETGNFTSYTETGSGIDVAKGIGVVDFNIQNSVTRDDAVWKDLGLLSDTKWRFDFDIDVTDFTTNSTINHKSFQIGISSTDGTNIVDTTADGIWFGLETFSSSNNFTSYWGNNESPLSNTSTFGTIENKKYFVSIIRLDDTNFTITLFADSARTIELYKNTVTNMDASGVTSLRYLRIQELINNTTNGNMIGTVSNIRVWDGITNPVDQETATRTDDFASDNFTDVGSLGVTGGVLTGLSVVDGGDDTSYYDLTSVSDTAWFMKYKVIMTTTHGSGAASHVLYFGLSDTFAPRPTAQDFIGCGFEQWNTPNGRASFQTKDGAVLAFPSSGVNVMNTFTSTIAETITKWITVSRNGDDFICTVYDDSAYTIVNQTISVTQTGITGLRYFSFTNRGESGSTSGSLTVSIDDLEFWDGIPSPNASGRKIVFTDNAFDGSAVEYSSETVSYDPINGDLEAVVKIPSLATGADTTIQMYCDYTPSANPSYVPELMPTGTADLDTVFDETASSHVSDNTVVGGWRSADASEHYYDGTNDWLYWNISRGTNDAISYDLTSVNDSKWTLRWSVQWDAFVSNAFNEQRWGISDIDSTSAHNGTHNFIGAVTQFWNSVARTIAPAKGDAGTITIDASGWTFDWDGILAVDTDIFIDIQRTSLTTYTISVSSTNEYKGDLAHSGEISCPAMTGLRYIWFGNENAGADDATMNSKVSNVKFYDGVALGIGNREQAVYDANYKAVYHLQGNSRDSTVYGNDGTNTAVDWEQQNNSVGLVANATTTKIDIGSSTSIDNLFEGGASFSVIINPNSDGELSTGRIYSKEIGTYIDLESESGGFSKLKMFVAGTSVNANYITTNAVIPNGELTSIDIIFTASNNEKPIFVINGIKYTVGNGLTETSTMAGGRHDDESVNGIIGNNTGQTTTFDGFINELRLNTKILPSSHAIASYNAEKSDSDFVTTGTEVTQ